MSMVLGTSIFNLSQWIPSVIAQYGSGAYVVLFLVVFIETGLVVVPFLPGDSLLFLAGSIAAISHTLNVLALIGLLGLAAIVGDGVNFEIGKRLGKYLIEKRRFRKVIRPQHLASAQTFFARHGNISIFLGRFVPFIRTLIPFVAGVSKMEYRNFVIFNVLGGITWVNIAIWSGYFWGNIPIIKDNFELMIIMVVLISVLPLMIPIVKRTWDRSQR